MLSHHVLADKLACLSFWLCVCVRKVYMCRLVKSHDFQFSLCTLFLQCVDLLLWLKSAQLGSTPPYALKTLIRIVQKCYRSGFWHHNRTMPTDFVFYMSYHRVTQKMSCTKKAGILVITGNLEASVVSKKAFPKIFWSLASFHLNA